MMSDTRTYHYPDTSNLPSEARHQFLHHNYFSGRPMRNSAPSRLQNFDDFYESGIMTSPDFNKAIKSKTSSLTNIFSFDKVPFICTETRNGHYSCMTTDCPCNATSGIMVPSNSPTESDVSASSPLDEEHIFDAILASRLKDTNNNDDFDEAGITPLSPDSTGLQDNDEVESCHDSENASVSPALSHDSKIEDNRLSQFIRRDTFGLASSRLNDPDTDLPVSSLTLGIEDDCESGCIVEELEREIKDEELISFSSESSDDTYVSYENLKVQGTIKAAVYRSLSDSKVHETHREPIKRRKSVHFADSSGYELEIHIPISQGDDYQTPPRLMEALEKIRAKSPNKKEPHERGGFNTLLRHYSLTLNFQQPFLEPTFQRRVNQQYVCLESVSILPNCLSFTGVIRVVNLEFEKKVTVRFSTDNWRTYTDIPSNYVSSLPEFQQDQFSFHVVASENITASGKFEMAICYHLIRSNKDFWDNNYNRNYTISCLEHRANESDDGMMT